MLALLTVRETFQFALDNSVSDPALLQNEEFARMHAQKVDYLLDLLGLREAENTILGNSVIRGVSGGQRRRVSVGEMMITNAWALFRGEITAVCHTALHYFSCAVAVWLLPNYPHQQSVLRRLLPFRQSYKPPSEKQCATKSHVGYDK